MLPLFARTNPPIMEDPVKAYVLEPTPEVHYWLVEGVGVIQRAEDHFELLDGTTQTFTSMKLARDFIVKKENAAAMKIARQKTQEAKEIDWQDPENLPSLKIG